MPPAEGLISRRAGTGSEVPMQDQYSVHPHEDVETHYAGLERLRGAQEEVPSCYCYGSGVVVLTVEEDGEEREEITPCRRCSS